MIEIFQYDFILRGLIAGIVIALIAPVIGIFLVLRRYSLIADTLAHISLAGIALGLLLHINPLITAIISTVASSAIMEKLRVSKKIYGESALAIFLSGSLAFAVIIIGISHGFTVSLFSYLFGSIVTVTNSEMMTILVLGFVVLLTMRILFRKLLYLTFDEEAAQVSGISASFINTIFMGLAAVTISLSIPVVGVLLISALLVIPVITALQLKKTFIPTMVLAQFFSILSVFFGVIISFYFNLPPGGTIVMLTLFFFVFVLLIPKSR